MTNKTITDLPANEEQRLQNLIEQTLNEATRQGATASEANIASARGLSIDVRLGEIETLEHHRDKGLSLTVYQGQKKGSASTSDFSDAAIQRMVEAALSIARYTSDDECAGLAAAEQMAIEIPDLDLYHPWDITTEQAIKLATTCEDTARQSDKRITNSDGASVSTSSAVSAYGNSHGFIGTRRGSRHGISCTMIAEDSNGKQRDFWYSSARNALELESPEAIGEQAAQRTLRRLGARKPDTCDAPVIFENRIAAGLFSHLASAISGGSLYRKTSFLLDKLGDKIFSDFVQISEQPHLLNASGSAPFDSDGLATYSKPIIQDGILQSYILSTYSARKLGMESTANAGGIHNLIVDPGQKSLDELLREMGTGLLVTELMGSAINMITGDYSRGATGFWVENGEIQYPVEEATIAGNLSDMFKQIVSIGNDIDKRGNIQCGSVLLENMTIAGK